MKCSGCGANIYDDVNRCQYCGAYQNVPQPNQPQTQQPIVVNVIQSHSSPAYQTPVQVPVFEQQQYSGANISSKSKWLALLLCFSLGVFGAHKFYVGKNGAGLLYLFTAGFFGIGWFIDFFAILFGAFTDKWGRPLRH